MKFDAHYSSKTVEWTTPKWVFDSLNREFAFTLDPCATPENAKCKTFFTKNDDGLKQDWSDHVVFMNPPYGRSIGKWIAKAHESTKSGATVVCLIHARTDTSWWHKFIMKHEIRFVRGRVKFGDGQGSCPFPSVIVVMRPIHFRLESQS